MVFEVLIAGCGASSSTSSSLNVFGNSSYDSRRHSQSRAALLVVLRAPLLAATAANALAALSSSKPAAVTPANAPARAAPASLSFAVSLVKRLAALPKGQPSSRFNTSPMASCAARDILLLYERSDIDAFDFYRCVSRVSCTDARPRRRRLALRPALSPRLVFLYLGCRCEDVAALALVSAAVRI